MSSRNGHKYTVVLLGKEDGMKCAIGDNIIGRANVFPEASNNFVRKESTTFVVINTPDVFNKYNPDQQIIDCMTLAEPETHLFILVLDRRNYRKERFSTQSDLLMDIRRQIRPNLLLMSPTIDYVDCMSCEGENRMHRQIYYSDLAKECEELCNREPFVWSKGLYKPDQSEMLCTEPDQSEAMLCTDFMTKEDSTTVLHNQPGPAPNSSVSIVRYGAAAPQSTSVTAVLDQPSAHAAEPVQDNCLVRAQGATLEQTEVIYETPDEMLTECPYAHCDNTEKHGVQSMGPKLNIVLLGQTGTGKSSTGNTILSAGDSSSKPFMSRPSSMPVTKECHDVESLLFGALVKVIDTPDFFDESMERPEEQIRKCREYCSIEPLVFLLVLQIGRFTESERDVLVRHEEALGMQIRDRTIVVLTHGEELKKKNLREFINADEHLRSVVKLCGDRYHPFNNKSTKPGQISKLLKLVPNYWRIFPDLDNKDKDYKDMCAQS